MASPRLFFIRHGETDWNAQGRLQGQRDIPLNAKGRLQADACGLILKGLVAKAGLDPASLDFVCSPLGRARETMERVRAGLGLPVDDYVCDPRLAEIAFGDWEGMTLPELRERDPALMAARERDKWRFIVPNGESYACVARRIEPLVAGLRDDTVVVAHGGVARALFVLAGLMSPDKATRGEIVQGVVYALRAGVLARHEPAVTALETAPPA